MVKTVGLLASSKSIEPSPPKEGGYECICRRAAGGPALLASRERVHVSHWLPLLGMFFHPCRCWCAILAAGCQFVAQWPSVCRHEWCDAVGRGSDGVLRRLSGLLQVMCAQVRGSQPGPQGMPSCAVRHFFPVNTGDVSRSVTVTSFPVSRHESSAIDVSYKISM